MTVTETILYRTNGNKTKKNETNPPIPEKTNEFAKQILVHNSIVIPLVNCNIKKPFTNGYVDNMPDVCEIILLVRPSLNAVHDWPVG